MGHYSKKFTSSLASTSMRNFSSHAPATQVKLSSSECYPLFVSRFSKELGATARHLHVPKGQVRKLYEFNLSHNLIYGDSHTTAPKATTGLCKAFGIDSSYQQGTQSDRLSPLGRRRHFHDLNIEWSSNAIATSIPSLHPLYNTDDYKTASKMLLPEELEGIVRSAQIEQGMTHATAQHAIKLFWTWKNTVRPISDDAFTTIISYPFKGAGLVLASLANVSAFPVVTQDVSDMARAKRNGTEHFADKTLPALRKKTGYPLDVPSFGRKRSEGNISGSAAPVAEWHRLVPIVDRNGDILFHIKLPAISAIATFFSEEAGAHNYEKPSELALERIDSRILESACSTRIYNVSSVMSDPEVEALKQELLRRV